MHLTKFTDHSVRVLMYLALKPKELRTISEISEKFLMSRNHLMKVVHRLASLGYVESVQGRGGGIRLAKPAELITVGMVIRDMETTLDLMDCVTNSCPFVTLSNLKGVVNKAMVEFLAVFDDHTIAELVQPKEQLLSLIDAKKQGLFSP